jgi:YVTN family beta-propeller protein
MSHLSHRRFHLIPLLSGAALTVLAALPGSRADFQAALDLMIPTAQADTIQADAIQAGAAVPTPNSVIEPNLPVSHHDRVYAAEQFSNTVSVIDPADNKLLGLIRLGDPQPMNFSPLYHGQVLVHGMGISPDRHTLAVVSIGSNSVTFIDTETNAVLHTTYVGRSPHEAFYTPDGKEVWVTVRGEDYVSVLDGKTFEETGRIKLPNGPGMTMFSPDGKYGYVCSSFNPVTKIIDTATKQIVGEVKQDSPFCPNIAVTAEGDQVWFTLKDVGKTEVFNGKPPFNLLKSIETGPITNHVNLARNAKGRFAYVTVGGLDQVKVFDTSDFHLVATIPVGDMPHGVWPSGDGSRVYVGNENSDLMMAIDTLTNKVVASIPIGQAPQAIIYAPGAVDDKATSGNLQPLGLAGQTSQLVLAGKDGKAATRVTLYNQGLTQVLQAAATGLTPKSDYVIALAANPKGTGLLEPLAQFKANPAGAAIVNAVGPIRQVVKADVPDQRRYLVIAPLQGDQPGAPLQLQMRSN